MHPELTGLGAPSYAYPVQEDGSESSGLTTVFEGERATVRRLRKAKLVVLDGPDKGKEVEISKSRCTGGRSIINDLVIADKSISGTHFEIAVRDDGYRLRDLNSRNGVVTVARFDRPAAEPTSTR